jgi:2-iminobutanoate/2-iminopropanoate deaminase
VSTKEQVSTTDAPAPLQGAPYSQAVRAGDFVFISGQLGLHPDEDGPVSDSVEEQTEQALANLAAILEAAGSDMSRVVKTTVYLTALADFAAMNTVYRERVSGVPPARATVAAGLPAGFLVEIEAIALA